MSSSSRSNAAALRRRAAPPGGEPMRGPNYGVQHFAQQQQQQYGTNRNIPPPSGKLAGQHAALQQQAQMQAALEQSAQEKQQQRSLTIPQAITLITLRLGKLESSMIEVQQRLDMPTTYVNTESGEPINSNILQDIVARLESLEKRGQQTNIVAPTSGPGDLNFLKTQMETIKNHLIQSKSLTLSSAKDAKEAKALADKLQEELKSTSQMVSELQSIVYETSQKITTLELNISNNDITSNYTMNSMNNEHNEYGIDLNLDNIVPGMDITDFSAIDLNQIISESSIEE